MAAPRSLPAVTLTLDLAGDARFEAVRAPLVAATAGRHATRFERREGDPLWDLGDAIAVQADLPRPAAAIAHRDCGIPRHTDRRNPYPCVNALVVYRSDATGGELTIDGDPAPWPCADGDCLIFDAQRPHEVSAVRKRKGGYRVGLVFYLPRP